MAKGKLVAALDAHKGKDYNLIKQKKLQKAAEKRKRLKPQSSASEEKENVDTRVDGTMPQPDVESEGWKSDESENRVETAQFLDDESSSNTSLENQTALKSDVDDPEDEEDIPVSEIESLASEERADILPHQRLTINNTSALLKSYKSIAFPYASLPFSAHQSLTASLPVEIADVNDDLNRELAFYKQCLDAANKGRAMLMNEGVSFSRPNDYFAEMVKSDEHMGKIKEKMTDEAARKKAASEARKQRDLKKFGKQVQVAKLQERDKAKRETLDKINLLKRKRKNNDTGAANEEDLFDVALEDAAKGVPASRSARDDDGRSRPKDKRRKKDEKFGFGGRKRFAKSNDAASTGDIRGFSSKKMKGKNPRLGKSRRAKT